MAAARVGAASAPAAARAAPAAAEQARQGWRQSCVAHETSRGHGEEAARNQRAELCHPRFAERGTRTTLTAQWVGMRARVQGAWQGTAGDRQSNYDCGWLQCERVPVGSARPRHPVYHSSRGAQPAAGVRETMRVGVASIRTVGRSGWSSSTLAGGARRWRAHLAVCSTTRPAVAVRLSSCVSSAAQAREHIDRCERKREAAQGSEQQQAQRRHRPTETARARALKQLVSTQRRGSLAPCLLEK